MFGVYDRCYWPAPSSARSRVETYRRSQDAFAFVYGRVLLKELIKDFRLPHSLDDLKYSLYGRPYLENTSFDFNISHSGGYVICVGSDETPVGVDIEEIRDIDAFKMQFRQDEWQQIIRSNERLQTCYNYWTKKEAVIKADGRGFNIPPADIRFVKGTCVQAYLDGITWKLRECKIDDAYKCFVASSKLIQDVILKKLK